MRSAVLSAYRRAMSYAPVEKDVFLYFCATAFAAATAAAAIAADYREWGQIAGVTYGVATLVCAVVSVAARRGALGASAVSLARRLVVVAVILGAVVAPLIAELVWRADARPGANAQSEVAVVERAGDRLARGESPYLAHPTTVGVSPRSDAKSIDANSFYPYLPGMAPFGLANAVTGPPELADARTTLAGFTLVVAAIALLAPGATVGRRGRVLQFLVVLPSGALPMVTGGDDLPVIALMLLGLALATRRRPVSSGLAMGLAGTLKFTAWPLLILLVLGEWDRRGRRAVWRYSLAAVAVVVPVLGIGVGLAPHAFILNAIRFPLGLTKVKSPAASPLIGQELVSLFPAAKPELITILTLVGLVAVGYGLLRWTPTTPKSAAGFSGLSMLLATLLAPATRFGYLIYPLDLLTWAVLLSPLVSRTGDGSRDLGQGQEPLSGTSNSRSLSPVTAEVCPSPASEGEIEGLTAVTATPTSHS